MADSDTTQPKRITVSLEAFNELKALTENIRAKAAAREAAAREAKAAAREAKADSGTAQHADIQPELDEAESEEAIAEKLFANSQRKANPLLTAAELWCVSFLFGALVAKALF